MLLSTRRVQTNVSSHQSIRNILQNANFDPSGIIRHKHPFTPPWIMHININTTLSLLPKADTLLSVYRNEFHSILEEHQEYTMYFTNGSKTDYGMGAAVLTNEFQKMFKLPDSCCLYGWSHRNLSSL